MLRLSLWLAVGVMKTAALVLIITAPAHWPWAAALVGAALTLAVVAARLRPS